MAKDGRAKVCTRNLGAAVVVGAGAGLAAPAVATAASQTTVFASQVCLYPGWVGAQTRQPISTSVFINAGHRCPIDSGNNDGWVRAWIHDSTANIIYSTGTQYQIAATGGHRVNGHTVRDYAKLESGVNKYDHITTASSHRTF